MIRFSVCNGHLSKPIGLSNVAWGLVPCGTPRGCAVPQTRIHGVLAGITGLRATITPPDVCAVLARLGLEAEPPSVDALVRLHILFREADTLGSLIDRLPREIVPGIPPANRLRLRRGVEQPDRRSDLAGARAWLAHLADDAGLAGEGHGVRDLVARLQHALGAEGFDALGNAFGIIESIDTER